MATVRSPYVGGVSMSRPLVDILLEIVVATAEIVLVLYVLFGPPA
jgi:hypothetical protein